MNKEALKNLFNFMKGLGKYKQYDTYADFHKDKYGSYKPTLKEWQEKEGFTDQDIKDWDYVWGEE